MKKTLLILLAGALISGCEKRGPIELVDPDLETENLQVLPLPAATAPEFALSDLDTGGMFSPAEGSAFGQLTIVGATIEDAVGPAREASLAHAVFYDRSAPLVVGSQRIGYMALDFGTVTIDDLLVTRAEKRFRFDGTDTLAGVQYALLNQERSGGRGFQYIGNHRYEWLIAGGPSPGVRLSIVSPPELRVHGSVNGSTIALGRTLKIKWSNRADAVRMIISELHTDGTARPLLHLLSRSERNGVAIPSSLLQVLRESSRVRLTLIAENSRSETLPGYPDAIMLKAVSIHSVVMRINR